MSYTPSLGKIWNFFEQRIWFQEQNHTKCIAIVCSLFKYSEIISVPWSYITQNRLHCWKKLYSCFDNDCMVVDLYPEILIPFQRSYRWFYSQMSWYRQRYSLFYVSAVIDRKTINFFSNICILKWHVCNAGQINDIF